MSDNGIVEMFHCVETDPKGKFYAVLKCGPFDDLETAQRLSVAFHEIAHDKMAATGCKPHCAEVVALPKRGNPA